MVCGRIVRETKKGGTGWTKDERKEVGSKKQVKKRQYRSKARSPHTMNLLISEVRARRIVGSLPNGVIEKGFGRKRSWRNEVTSSYVPSGNEENHEKSIRVTSDPDSHVAREEYEGCPESIQQF
jgi:hypothetical protein